MNRNFHRRPRRLCFEPLERRRQLASDVTVNVVGGDLFITGDDSGNNIVLTSTGISGEFVVAPLENSTTINGGTLPVTVSGVVGDVTIDLADGSDFLEFDTDPSALQFSGDVSVDMGLNPEPPWLLNIVVAWGVNPFSIAGSLHIVGYRVRATLFDPLVGGDLNFAFDGDMGEGQLVGGSVGGNLTASSTGENKNLQIDASIAGDVNINLVGVGDRINFAGASGSPVQVGGSFNVTLDTDSLSLEYTAVNGDLMVDGSGSVDLLHSSVGDNFIVSTWLTVGGSASITLFASSVAGNALFTLSGESSVSGGLLTDGNGMPLPTPFNQIGGNLDITFGSGSGSTRLNYFNVTNDLLIWGTGGAQDVRLNNVRVGNNLLIDTGGGNDIVWIHNSSCEGEAEILAGAGSDYVWTHNVLCAHNLNVDAAAGFDLVSIWYTSAAQNLHLSAGVDSDQVGVYVSSAKDLTIDAGGGYDLVRIESSAADTLYADMGDGGDSLAIITSLVRKWALLDGGPGYDALFQSGSLLSGVARRNFEFMSG